MHYIVIRPRYVFSLRGQIFVKNLVRQPQKRNLCRGRDRPHGRPPAQIPASGITALGSCLGYWRRTERWVGDAEVSRSVATGVRCAPSAASYRSWPVIADLVELSG